MKHNIVLFAVICILFAGCKNTGRTLTSATGSIYEMLIIIDKPLWETAAGEAIKEIMTADMPCLPQMEPYFSITQVSPQHFDDFLMPTRNILYVDVNPDRYTQCKVKYLTDQWSTPQAVCRIQCADTEQLLPFIENNGENIRNWFVRQEMLRQGKFYRNYSTTDTREAVQLRFGCDISIPSDFLLVRNNSDLVWAVNDGGSLRRDLIIWSYPYTSQEQLTRESLLKMRDEILGSNVSGSLEGTYMGTEYKHFPPVLTEINVNNRWCAEIRGLWKMQGGEAMGGPFVQHTRIDEINHRVVTAEVFVFAPGQKKRNALRQTEAILYTLRLPQEINQLKEVEISANE